MPTCRHCRSTNPAHMCRYGRSTGGSVPAHIAGIARVTRWMRPCHDYTPHTEAECSSRCLSRPSRMGCRGRIPIPQCLRSSRIVHCHGSKRAEDYEPDYIWDIGGRTGEAKRVDPNVRAELIRRSAARMAKTGELFAPGLYDDIAATGNLKSLAHKLEPAAEQIRESARKGKGNGDSKKD
jgi:hypothetical protein